MFTIKQKIISYSSIMNNRQSIRIFIRVSIRNKIHEYISNSLLVHYS
uniref:Uncharacterized protein n=1 Tax=Anguilla anguilla TaxID=7936 RepID=A0A0E9PHB9_ANGAN